LILGRSRILFHVKGLLNSDLVLKVSDALLRLTDLNVKHRCLERRGSIERILAHRICDLILKLLEEFDLLQELIYKLNSLRSQGLVQYLSIQVSSLNCQLNLLNKMQELFLVRDRMP